MRGSLFFLYYPRVERLFQVRTISFSTPNTSSVAPKFRQFSHFEPSRPFSYLRVSLLNFPKSSQENKREAFPNGDNHSGFLPGQRPKLILGLVGIRFQRTTSEHRRKPSSLPPSRTRFEMSFPPGRTVFPLIFVRKQEPFEAPSSSLTTASTEVTPPLPSPLSA